MKVAFLFLMVNVGSACEVCMATVKAVDALVEGKRTKTSVIAALEKHCGDLQNENPNPALGPRDLKMCYYMLPIKMDVADLIAMRMPADRICKKLEKKNDEICTVKYPKKLEQDADMPAKLKKMRIKELRSILNDRGIDRAKIDNFVEKDEYINEILATNHLDL